MEPLLYKSGLHVTGFGFSVLIQSRTRGEVLLSRRIRRTAISGKNPRRRIFRGSAFCRFNSSLVVKRIWDGDGVWRQELYCHSPWGSESRVSSFATISPIARREVSWGFVDSLKESLLRFVSRLKECGWRFLCLIKAQGWIVLVVLWGFAAFLAISETALTSLASSEVEQLAKSESEDTGFRLLSKDPNRFLSTILVASSVVSTLSSTFLASMIESRFSGQSVALITAIMTVMVPFITDITPKNLAALHSLTAARFAVNPIATLSLFLYPLAKLFTNTAKGLLQIVGLKSGSSLYVTNRELKLMVQRAGLSGQINKEEKVMFENMLNIRDRMVMDVMTPLVNVAAIERTANLKEFCDLFAKFRFSRIPIYDERVDNIVNIAYAKDIVNFSENVQDPEAFCISEAPLREANFVPESMSAWDLLVDFKVKQYHMAIVQNEYGGTVGIITQEDLVEEIIGEIYDEKDSEASMVKNVGTFKIISDGLYEVDASRSIHQLTVDLNIKLPKDADYETTSGFICDQFGCIPQPGETSIVVLEKEEKDEYRDSERESEGIQNDYLVFEIQVLSGNLRRVKKVQFKRIPPEKLKFETKDGMLIPRIEENWEEV
ncbi:DUF21 domain-containing protein At1g55930, chloroplastic-like [Aristolochia californica]|uniref:DUF21 domain-containing protein At1g55930, chloroplastic-like n=1 Tax=Aristolochia californica TaxID=171875 RepID=UPI0035D58A50